jgi:hypothetical protein
MGLRRQPWLGVLSAGVVIAASLAFVGLFDWSTFRDRVSFFLVCAVPVAFVVGPFWHAEHPRSLARLPQPWRGLGFLGLTLVVAGVAATVLVATVGHGISPPTAMVAQCAIIAVPFTFWLSAVMGGWPFSLLPSRLLAGWLLLLAAYGVTVVVFRLTFDYGAWKGGPAYVESVDPHGLFDAWTALVFIVTWMAAAFVVLHLEMWPLRLHPSLVRQPVLGLVWTGGAIVVAAVAMWLGVGMAGLAAPVFLVTVPVPFLFGSIVVLTTLEGSLLARTRQPLRGAASVLLAAVLGFVLARLYVWLLPRVTGDVPFGAPGFQGEVWLASALLGVTFPFLAFHADYFGLWPLRAATPAAETQSTSTP